MHFMGLNHKGLPSYQTKMSYNLTTIFTAKMIFKKSKTMFYDGSSSTINHSFMVRCQSAPKASNFVESYEDFDQGPIQPLEGVVRCSTNYVPLSPISFLERAAEVYKDRTSIIYGSIKHTWKETHQRCLKLAYALNHLGISRGDIVAILAPNIPAMLELHFAIPMSGAIICALNTRLDAKMLSTHLSHSEAKLLFVDYQFLRVAEEAIKLLDNIGTKPPLLIIISELDSFNPSKLAPISDYESLINETTETKFRKIQPSNECDPISLNYTSGTTSRPKGVIFSHRGAYLNSIACVFTQGMRDMPISKYLWSVPMFHCNGWCFTWGTALVGATNICLRRCDPKVIFENIVVHKVTHMCGAPTVLNIIANSLMSEQKQLPHIVEIMTGGAPPPPSILSKITALGFHVCHIYGLTETYGPATWCLQNPEWDLFPLDEQLKLNARQGVKHFGMEEVDVKDPITMENVKCDGKTIGEIMFRGNTVMSGYLKDLRATHEAFSGGWFRSGDLGVKHADGYIEVKDRLKDIVISGGENISTIEVETVIYNHPGVLEVAVVGRPDKHWGQTPCAFVKLKEGVVNVDAQEIIQYCRDNMPHYMAPRTIVFEDLPRNSTGKIQKFLLRNKAEALGSLS